MLQSALVLAPSFFFTAISLDVAISTKGRVTAMKRVAGYERNLPELFSTEGMTLDTWETKRRQEILDIFRHEVYGVVPDEMSMEVSFRTADVKCSKEIMGGNATRKTIEVMVRRKG